jgi:hypothetical protein
MNYSGWIFREWSLRFGEFPEIIDVIGVREIDLSSEGNYSSLHSRTITKGNKGACSFAFEYIHHYGFIV